MTDRVPGELVIKPQSTLEQILWIDSTLAKVGTKVGTKPENKASTEETAVAQDHKIIEENWSRRSGLNRRPADYESAALPLSYAGARGRVTGEVGPVL